MVAVADQMDTVDTADGDGKQESTVEITPLVDFFCQKEAPALSLFQSNIEPLKA